MSRTAFILGAGRAGRSLARALAASGVRIVGAHGRRAERGDPEITAGDLPRTLSNAGVVLVTVRDAQLETALGDLAASPALAPGAVVLHASGSADPAALARLRAAGHPCGTFHPLVPLSNPDDAAVLLRGAWIGIDGDPEAQLVSRELAAALGAEAMRIPAGGKARYHAAAVMASNFPAVLASVAEQLLVESGVEPSSARAATLSLLRGALRNLDEAAVRGQPFADVLTGPVRRGDVETVRAHVDALRGSAAVSSAYMTLTRLAVAMLRERGAGGDLTQIERLLD